MSTETNAPEQGPRKEAPHAPEGGQEASAVATVAELAAQRAQELRAAAGEAEEAAEKLATAAEEARPSLLYSLASGALWAGAAFLVTWGLSKLLEKPEEQPFLTRLDKDETEPSPTNPTSPAPTGAA